MVLALGSGMEVVCNIDDGHTTTTTTTTTTNNSICVVHDIDDDDHTTANKDNGINTILRLHMRCV